MDLDQTAAQFDDANVRPVGPNEVADAYATSTIAPVGTSDDTYTDDAALTRTMAMPTRVRAAVQASPAYEELNAAEQVTGGDKAIKVLCRIALVLIIIAVALIVISILAEIISTAVQNVSDGISFTFSSLMSDVGGTIGSSLSDLGDRIVSALSDLTGTDISSAVGSVIDRIRDALASWGINI